MALIDLTAVQISQLLGSPLKNVQAHWPILRDELKKIGADKYDTSIAAALATIGVECREFKPINEHGGNQYFFAMYDCRSPFEAGKIRAKELGNVNPGDGALFHGRGFIQTTGRNNYRALKPILHVDCEANPDILLDPHAAATAFAYYWQTHGCGVWAHKSESAPVSPCAFCDEKEKPSIADKCCKECCWKMVRRKVNGGLTNYAGFKKLIDSLIVFAC